MSGFWRLWGHGHIDERAVDKKAAGGHNLLMNLKMSGMRRHLPGVFFLLPAILLMAVNNGLDRFNLIEWTDQPLAGEILPAPWKLKKKKGFADLSIVSQLGERIIRLRSVKASFAVERKLRLSALEYPIISWKWKVTQLPENGDFRVSERDDQAAQLFVMFGKSKAIVYLWDSNAPEKMVSKISSPPFVDLRVMVLRSGSREKGIWVVEERDLRQDYHLVFGAGRIPQIRGIRIQINSQHTQASAESYFSDLHLDREIKN